MSKFAAVMAFLSLLCSPAFAVIDVAATTSDLGEVKTAVLSVGVAVLAIVVGIKLYKWVKAAL